MIGYDKQRVREYATEWLMSTFGAEDLRQVRDTAHLKLQVKSGWLKLAELGSNRHAPGG